MFLGCNVLIRDPIWEIYALDQGLFDSEAEFGRVCSSVCLSVWHVCLSVSPSVRPSVRLSDYLKTNERICMDILPDVCLGTAD